LVIVVCALALLLAGCPNPDTPPPSDEPTPTPSTETLVVLQANVGNLDEVFDGICPSVPYRGAQCELEVEAVIAAGIEAQQADIVFLLEVVDADLCPQESWDGDPELACTDAPDRDPYQQARRLLGDDFTITCDAIAHYDCIGVRASRIEIEQCPAGDLCMGASVTPEQPAECEGIGSITSVSKVHATLDELTFSGGAVHPLNTVRQSEDGCRRAQYVQAFEELSSDGPALVAGDMNMDPYRVPDLFPSGQYWHTMVGPERRFEAHSVTADPPVPTWGGGVTLDYVLSDFLVGDDCIVLGEELATLPLDGALDRMDHRAVRCELQLP